MKEARNFDALHGLTSRPRRSLALAVCALVLFQAQCAVPAADDYAVDASDKLGPGMVLWGLAFAGIATWGGITAFRHNQQKLGTVERNREGLSNPPQGQGAANPATIGPQNTLPGTSPSYPAQPAPSPAQPTPSPSPSPSRPTTSPSQPSTATPSPRAPTSQRPSAPAGQTADERERAAILKAARSVSDDVRRVTRARDASTYLGAFCEFRDGEASNACRDANLTPTPRLASSNRSQPASMVYWVYDRRDSCWLLHATRLRRPDAPGYREVMGRFCLEREAPGCYVVENREGVGLHDANFPAERSPNNALDITANRASVAFIMDFKPDGSDPRGQVIPYPSQLQLAHIGPHTQRNGRSVPNACMSAHDPDGEPFLVASGCSYSRLAIELAQRSDVQAVVPAASRARVLSCNAR